MAFRLVSSSWSLLAFGILAAGPALAGSGACATCYRQVVSPPVYAVTEEVVLKPRGIAAYTVPGVLASVDEPAPFAPGRRVWRTSVDAYGNVVGCLVTLPARFGVAHRSVVVQPRRVVYGPAAPAVTVRQRTTLVRPAVASWVPVAAPF